MALRLCYTTGDLPLDDGGVYLIGRDPTCDVPLADARVSGCHAQLSVSHGVVIIEDLGSPNGVMLNGSRLTAGSPVPVRVGDRILVGGFELLLLDVPRRDEVAC